MSATTGRLTDEVVVAIGCGTPDGQTNNGLAAARAFLAEGARVCLVDRLPQALEEARRVLLEEDPQAADRLTEAVADVVDDAQLAAAIDAAAALFGPPTVLHYNVGIVVNGGVEELEVDAFRRALDINLTGAFAAMKHVVPHMRAAGRGSIITVASTGGMRWMGYDYPAYAASKAALIELTNSVGLRYAREGIRANSISPGLIETPLIRTSITGHYGSVEEMLAARHAASPTGQMGQPEDVGAAAVFLASQESRYINATCVPVDGGLIHTTSVAAAQH
ncbi:MAG TPA: SDR family oxidoreductase [Candidatus Brevibacterium intestinigallinarum]|nr:SDR family oxidoreductase [Candidatus Brevibacterium intestinigallinarum]